MHRPDAETGGYPPFLKKIKKSSCPLNVRPYFFSAAAILESYAGSKRCFPDGQDLIFNMNNTSIDQRL